MNFIDVKSIFIPEGEVYTITDGDGNILWQKDSGETYTFLTCIIGTGTQYIDTEWLHTSLNEEYEIDISLNSIDQQNILFSNANDVAINIYKQNTTRGTLYAKYGQLNYSQRTNINPQTYATRAIWKLFNGYLYRGNSQLMNPTISSSIPAQTDAIKLLTSDGSSCIAAKLYSFVISDRSSGDTLMDLVPAMRDSDGEVGMYDNVSGNFFMNAGSGTFNYE